MDVTQIIITIGLVLAGLLVLWAIIAGIFAFFARRAFKQEVQEMNERHDAFKKRHGFR